MNEDFYYQEDNEDEIEGFDHSGCDSGADDDSLDFTEDDLQLAFIKKIGTESGGINIYEFLFTTNPDEFWGEGFNVVPAGICNYLEPYNDKIQKTVRVKMLQNLDLAQKNNSFSMQDCLDGVIALGWQSLVGLEDYPEYRLVFNFGESYTEVENKLAKCHILMGI